MVEIDKRRSFRHNLQMGCSKEDLMRYYLIESEEKWNRIMEKLKPTKMQEDVKAFRKKMIMGKEMGERNDQNVP